jgi:ribosomal protein L11 methyltransferase
LIRLAVRCPPELADAVLAELLVLAPNGVEEGELGGQIEYAIYGAPGELPELGGLTAAAGEGVVKVESVEVPDDWADRWRDFHEPTSIAGGRIVVRPSWGSGDEQPVGIDVVIDPGQAFGTGAHPTTRMCLEFLVELADAGEANGPLADLGTGSGVLAIAAAKLGFGPVTAYDHETAAVEAAGANAEANGATVAFERLDLRSGPMPGARTLVANLTAPLLREVAAGIHASPPERMVCSGLLVGEADEISGALAAAGLHEADRRVEGDWAALCLRAE